MVSFKNMDAYFKAIGVPSFAISFVKKMKEVRTIEPPEEPGGEWSVVVETGRMIIMLFPPKCRKWEIPDGATCIFKYMYCKPWGSMYIALAM